MAERWLSKRLGNFNRGLKTCVLGNSRELGNRRLPGDVFGKLWVVEYTLDTNLLTFVNSHATELQKLFLVVDQVSL